MDVYLQWIVDAWKSLSKDLIIKSFKARGITTAANGSEAGDIHCFKKDEPVSAGRAKIQQACVDTELAELLEEIELEQEEEKNLEYHSDCSLEWMFIVFGVIIVNKNYLLEKNFKKRGWKIEEHSLFEEHSLLEEHPPRGVEK